MQQNQSKLISLCWQELCAYKILRYRTTTMSILKRSSCELFQAFIVNHQEVMKSIHVIKIIICRSLLNDVTNAVLSIAELEDSHSLSVIPFLLTVSCTVPLLHLSFFLSTLPSCLLPSSLRLLQESLPALLRDQKHNNLSLTKFWHFLLTFLLQLGSKACENEK